MTFREYYRSLNAQERKALAERMGTSSDYIRMLGNGHRRMGAELLLKVEQATYGRVSQQEARL